MPYDVPQLLNMPQVQLDELFTDSPAGDIPNGEAKGTAIIAPGTTYSADIAELINHFGWQGKVFDAKSGTLKNRILAFGLQAIIAKVYKGTSWMDAKECIVLDYSETSLIAHRTSFIAHRSSFIAFATKFALLLRSAIWASSTGTKSGSSILRCSFELRSWRIRRAAIGASGSDP